MIGVVVVAVAFGAAVAVSFEVAEAFGRHVARRRGRERRKPAEADEFLAAIRDSAAAS